MFVTPEALAAVLNSTAKNTATPILEVVALYSDASQTHSMAALATDRYQVSKFVPEWFDGALESPTAIMSRETATAIIKSKAQAEIDPELHTATLVTGAVLPLIPVSQQSYLVPSDFPSVARFFPDAKDFAPKMDYGISLHNLDTVTKNIRAYNRAVSNGKRASGFRLRFLGGTEPKALVDITDEFSMLLMEWVVR